MLESARARILEELGPGDVVLDVGGWADPFERADWVIDLLPYETRGLYRRRGWVGGRDEGEQPVERFDAETWIQRDVCSREPFPFSDDEIDFAICAHTLEDVRDPIWVCSELVRVAKAGYIEVPSRLEEQSYGVAGHYVGWPHHHWLIDVEPGRRIDFVFKSHEIHADPAYHFPRGFHATLSEDERVHSLWWRGSFDFSERPIVDDLEKPIESIPYLRDFVERELAERGMKSGPAPLAKRLAERTGLRRRSRAG